jgi:RES domain-containing protein
MNLFGIDTDRLLYRINHPRFAHSPASGEGAKRHGGRFNRPGTSALYLALSLDTAHKEYQQDSDYLMPGTHCSYRLTRPGQFVDLRRIDRTWDDLWLDWAMDWRRSWFEQGIEPPTWLMADLVLAAGHDGILFPSTRPGLYSPDHADGPDGLNLVVYSAIVSPIDPGHMLPDPPP